MTDLIHFIVNDVKQVQQRRGAKAFCLLGYGALVWGLGQAIAVFAQGHLSHGLLPYLGLSVLLIVLGVFEHPRIGRYRYLAILTVVTLIEIGLSLAASLRSGSQEQSWVEVLSMAAGGVVLSALFSFLLCQMIFRLYPLPCRFWQIAIAVIAALSGVVALGFSGSQAGLAQVVLGSWGHCLISIPLGYALAHRMFMRRLRLILGDASQRIEDLNCLDWVR